MKVEVVGRWKARLRMKTFRSKCVFGLREMLNVCVLVKLNRFNKCLYICDATDGIVDRLGRDIATGPS